LGAKEKKIDRKKEGRRGEEERGRRGGGWKEGDWGKILSQKPSVIILDAKSTVTLESRKCNM
jgi:hypothetical protein